MSPLNGGPERDDRDRTCAVLVFADPLPLDLARRRWPRSFARLLQPPSWRELPGTDVHVFSSTWCATSTASAGEVSFHRRRGSGFAESLETSVETLAALGYRRIVVVGRDCPDLDAGDIRLALDELERRTLVVGPDHRGGVYLIGIRIESRALLRGVRWRENRDCDQLKARVPASELYLLPVKQDLDDLADLQLLSRSRSSWGPIAEQLLRQVERLGDSPFEAVPPPRPAAREVITWQRPPPTKLA